VKEPHTMSVVKIADIAQCSRHVWKADMLA
jgi:hypothetical protein